MQKNRSCNVERLRESIFNVIFKKIEKEAIKIEFVKRKKERKKWKERKGKKEKDRSRGLFLIKDGKGKEQGIVFDM